METCTVADRYLGRALFFYTFRVTFSCAFVVDLVLNVIALLVPIGLFVANPSYSDWSSRTIGYLFLSLTTSLTPIVTSWIGCGCCSESQEDEESDAGILTSSVYVYGASLYHAVILKMVTSGFVVIVNIACLVIFVSTYKKEHLYVMWVSLFSSYIVYGALVFLGLLAIVSADRLKPLAKFSKAKDSRVKSDEEEDEEQQQLEEYRHPKKERTKSRKQYRPRIPLPVMDNNQM